MSGAQARGIHQLIKAENKALQKINEAKRKRTERLKQARDEANEELSVLRRELEGKFAQFERENHGNREETQKIIDAEIEKELQEMENHVAENRDVVIDRILNLVCDIQPELHHNLQLQQKLSARSKNNTEGA